MKKLLSLPPNLVGCFHDVTGLSHDEWFCTSDPVGRKLGSGGGTAWLLRQAHGGQGPFEEWLKAEKRILIHAGGQSRRLPAYAPSGKILTPLPVFRWERGQRLSQDLLSLQVPLYERIMAAAPDSMHTMVVSGDVYIRASQPLQAVPEADVVCYGLWLGPETAKNHGVFVSSRSMPTQLHCMLQKPSVRTLGALMKDYFYLTDIGIWLFSDWAVQMLMRRCEHDGQVDNYDMYGEFGCSLGSHPGLHDEELNSLTVAVLPLPGGEFYHFGTSREVISSTVAVQNLVNDQRAIMHHSLKPHPAMFVQNAVCETSIGEHNQQLWIENSHVGSRWTLARENIITGVPRNDWKVDLRAGQCVDIVPVGEEEYCVRPYGFDDLFRGAWHHEHTLFLGIPFAKWAEERQIDLEKIDGEEGDVQTARIFPVTDNMHDAGLLLRWMLGETGLQGARSLWEESRRLSADDISAEENLERLVRQRADFRTENWQALARNHEHSVFYQLDLEDAARAFSVCRLPEPRPLQPTVPLMTRIHDSMFRSELKRQLATRINDGVAAGHLMEQARNHDIHAFALLREGLTERVLAERQSPRLSVYADQIVWSRSPVRVDIAGGWTDTPPYCLMEGGNVVNMAIELNGQPPLQAYVKPCSRPVIILRSIDLGATEEVHTYEELADYRHVGSPFSIPKAALGLAGFLPNFSTEQYDTLEHQLLQFGCGVELTLLSAVPAGSGLGTSSLLAATVLGALSDFCGLAWDKNEIGNRTLVLEQLLTTGGGWQDQFGGILQGVKLLQTEQGFEQNPVVRWLPDHLFTQPEYAACHLLYYTGITRTAKTILSEIVRRMFLNQHDELALLREMRDHALEMYETIQRADFAAMGRLVGKTWRQNQAIDSGTTPLEVLRITQLVDDLCLGYKLAGAGGGGYLYMVAKDPQAAARIRQSLPQDRPNARFVDMRLSSSGLQVSRS